VAAARIWLARLADEAALARYALWLTPQEAARATGFARPQRRRQFLTGRALLRIGLGDMLGIAPEAIALDAVPGRAPALLAPQGGVAGISVSHSGAWVACAASVDTALGLDIETRGPTRDVMALAGQAFDTAARARLAALAPAERPDLFYAMWSELEARIKLGLEGQGGSCIALPHEELSVVLCSGAPLAAPPVLDLRVL